MDLKRWIFVICLLSVLLQIEAGYHVSSEDSGRSIDDIIHESWNRLLSQNKINAVNKPQPKNDKRQLFDHHEHHGECTSEKWMSKFDLLKSVTLPTSEPQERSNTHSSNHKRTTQAMRFYVDDSVMTSGADPQACYHVMDTIYIDEGPTPYTCTTADILSDGLIGVIKDSIIPTMLQIFSSVLSLKPSQQMDPLKLDSVLWTYYGQECDTNVPINASYITTGIANTDYVLFVTARPTADSNTIAYAGGCNFANVGGGRYSRPYAGILNLNPRWFQGYVTSMSLFDYKKALKIAMHEVTHALGFTSLFYDSYIDNATGTFYDPSIWFSYQNVGVAPSGQSYNQTIQKLRSPNVLRFARDYFNCSELDGVELEDFGGSLTAGSHWERRVCGEGSMSDWLSLIRLEYMTGFASDQMWISGFTLSLFDDMGWYDVDRTKVEYLGWGKDQGCSFVQSRCESSWPSASPGYWCTGTVSGCTADRVGVGSCSLSSSQIDPYYQHFSDPLLGGTDKAADYCPYTYPWTSCRDTSQTPKSNLFEVYGEHSRCWEVSNGTTSLVCYPFQCINNNTVLQVQVGSTWVSCPTEGGPLSVSAILGDTTTINCPKTSLFCRTVDGFEPQVLLGDTLQLPSTSPARSPSGTPSVISSPSGTPTPSRTASSTATPSPSISPSSTSTPSVTPSISPSVSVTPSPSVTPSATPTPTTSPTTSSTPTPSPTSSTTPSPTTTPTTTSTPSVTPTTSTSPSITPSNSVLPPTPSASISSSPFICPPANVTATITSIDYDPSTFLWTVQVQTSVSHPYYLGSPSLDHLTGNLAQRPPVVSVSPCAPGRPKCIQTIAYIYPQGSALNACLGLTGQDKHLFPILYSIASCQPDPATYNMTLQLDTGDACPATDDVTFSEASLTSYQDSSLSIPSHSFDIKDKVYFGASVQTTRAVISSRTLKPNSVCFQPPSGPCLFASYSVLASTAGKDPVFVVDLTNSENAKYFSNLTAPTQFAVNAVVQVDFVGAKSLLKNLPQTQTVQMSTHAGIQPQTDASMSSTVAIRPWIGLSLLVLLLQSVL